MDLRRRLPEAPACNTIWANAIICWYVASMTL